MTINGKTYKMPELNFNTVCKLEDMGVSLTTKDTKTMSTIRGFVALAVGDVQTAGKELEAHIVSGGKLDDILTEINHSIEDSGFFQALGVGRNKKTHPRVMEKTIKATGK